MTKPGKTPADVLSALGKRWASLQKDLKAAEDAASASERDAIAHRKEAESLMARLEEFESFLSEAGINPSALS